MWSRKNNVDKLSDDVILKTQEVEELNELIKVNETQLDQKRNEFKELESLEQERNEQFAKLSEELELRTKKVEELNELINVNEAQLNRKRIEFRELELMEQERIEKIDKLSRDIDLRGTKSEELNTSRSSMFSPNPMNFTGILNSFAIPITTPPFAVPSSFVNTIPVRSTARLNSSTCLLAFCPIVASNINKVS